MRSLRSWVLNGLVVLVALLVGAGLSELAIRIFFPQPLGVWHHDREGLALHWPGRVTYLPQFGQSVSFNSEGMRDREHPLAKPQELFRILLLGDSFLEALQVPFESSFPSLLERSLDGKTGRRIEVVNASVSGWGTDDELQYLTTYGMRWKPDLVVVAVTLHNDLSDNLRQRFYAMRNGALIERPRDRATFLDYKLVQLKGFLATRSHGYQLFMRARRAREMQGEAQHLGSHVLELFKEDTGPGLSRAVELTGLLLDRIKTTVAAEHGRVVVVLLPLSLQVPESRFVELTRAVPGPKETWRLDKPQRLVAGVAERAGLPVIDLLPGFRDWSGSGGEPTYLQGDGHWNAQGHRLAANLVSHELIVRGLVP